MRKVINKFRQLALELMAISLLLSSGVFMADNPPIRLTDAEVSQQLGSLPGWQIENGSLQRTFQFANFVEAIAFVNQLVEPAEQLGHHPDITIIYNKVMISITTHDAGGLTQMDFELAKRISEIANR